MTPNPPSALRCERCGEPIEDGEDAVVFATVSFADGEQTESWSHDRCFPRVSVDEFTGRVRP